MYTKRIESTGQSPADSAKNVSFVSANNQPVTTTKMMLTPSHFNHKICFKITCCHLSFILSVFPQFLKKFLKMLRKFNRE